MAHDPSKLTAEQPLNRFDTEATKDKYRKAFIKFIKFIHNEDIIFYQRYTDAETARYMKLLNIYLQSDTDKIGDLYRFAAHVHNVIPQKSNHSINHVIYLFNRLGYNVNAEEQDRLNKGLPERTGVPPKESKQSTLPQEEPKPEPKPKAPEPETPGLIVPIKKYLERGVYEDVRHVRRSAIFKFIDFVKGRHIEYGGRYDEKSITRHIFEIDVYMESDRDKFKDLVDFSNFLKNRSMYKQHSQKFSQYVADFFRRNNIDARVYKGEIVDKTVTAYRRSGDASTKRADTQLLRDARKTLVGPLSIKDHLNTFTNLVTQRFHRLSNFKFIDFVENIRCKEYRGSMYSDGVINDYYARIDKYMSIDNNKLKDLYEFNRHVKNTKSCFTGDRNAPNNIADFFRHNNVNVRVYKGEVLLNNPRPTKARIPVDVEALIVKPAEPTIPRCMPNILIENPYRNFFQDEKMNCETIKNIINRVDAQGRAITLMIISSGMFVYEILQLTTDDITYYKTGPTEIIIQSKYTYRKHSRVVFLNKEATDALKEWRTISSTKYDRYVNSKIFSLKPSAVSKLWKKAQLEIIGDPFDAKSIKVLRNMFEQHLVKYLPEMLKRVDNTEHSCYNIKEIKDKYEEVEHLLYIFHPRVKGGAIIVKKFEDKPEDLTKVVDADIADDEEEEPETKNTTTTLPDYDEEDFDDDDDFDEDLDDEEDFDDNDDEEELIPGTLVPKPKEISKMEEQSVDDAIAQLASVMKRESEKLQFDKVQVATVIEQIEDHVMTTDSYITRIKADLMLLKKEINIETRYANPYN